MPAERVPSVSPTIQLGLKENLGQFSLLVLVNAFVGGWWVWSARWCLSSAPRSSG